MRLYRRQTGMATEMGIFPIHGTLCAWGTSDPACESGEKQPVIWSPMMNSLNVTPFAGSRAHPCVGDEVVLRGRSAAFPVPGGGIR